MGEEVLRLQRAYKIPIFIQGTRTSSPISIASRRSRRLEFRGVDLELGPAIGILIRTDNASDLERRRLAPGPHPTALRNLDERNSGEAEAVQLSDPERA